MLFCECGVALCQMALHRTCIPGVLSEAGVEMSASLSDIARFTARTSYFVHHSTSHHFLNRWFEGSMAGLFLISCESLLLDTEYWCDAGH